MRIVSLIDTLIEESQITMNCVKDNNMIVTPKKFLTVFVLKTKKHHTWGLKHLYQWRKHETTEFSKDFKNYPKQQCLPCKTLSSA